ncbi:MAG: type III-B CRISPR module RAMP protein Cmr1 [candidate division WOR-3 bacterium]
MYYLRFKCKLITPMFMYGADGKTPELRPSEFKGMMRWWWRAIRAQDDYQKMKEQETEIFGGSGEIEGRSKVKIKISSNIEVNDIIDYQPLPHHQRNNCQIDKNPNCNKAFKLKAIRIGKDINIDFYFTFREIEPLLYLIFILGGFGKRSRRGFGSFHIITPPIEINNEKILELLNRIDNDYEIANSQFLDGVKTIKHKKQKNGNYPWIKEIILTKKEFNNADDILKAIAIASHKHSDNSLGSANPRMSSPIYVSVVNVNNKLHSIITVLNSYFPSNYPHWNFNKQKDLIKELA